MVSRLLSCQPVRARLASRPGLLLLLGEGNDEDADGEAVNMDLQPGEGPLLPSPGDEADIDLLTPPIEGQRQIKGSNPAQNKDAAENNLQAPTIQGRIYKKGFNPTTDEKGFVPAAAEHAEAGPHPDEGDLLLLSEIGNLFDPTPDMTSTLLPLMNTGDLFQINFSKFQFHLDDGALCHASVDDATDGGDHSESVKDDFAPHHEAAISAVHAPVEFNENNDLSDADNEAVDGRDTDVDTMGLAFFGDVEADDGLIDSGDLHNNGSDALQKTNRASVLTDEFDADFDEEHAVDSGAEFVAEAESDYDGVAADEAVLADPTDSDDDVVESVDVALVAADGEGVVDPAQQAKGDAFDENSVEFALLLTRHAASIDLHAIVGKLCAERLVFTDSIINHAKPRLIPKVKKKTSLLLCITIKTVFHPGERCHDGCVHHYYPHHEPPLHCLHSSSISYFIVALFDIDKPPYAININTRWDFKNATRVMPLLFPILRGSKGHQDAEKQTSPCVQIVRGGSRMKTKVFMMLIIQAVLDPG